MPPEPTRALTWPRTPSTRPSAASTRHACATFSRSPASSSTSAPGAIAVPRPRGVALGVALGERLVARGPVGRGQLADQHPDALARRADRLLDRVGQAGDQLADLLGAAPLRHRNLHQWHGHLLGSSRPPAARAASCRRNRRRALPPSTLARPA